MRLPRRCGRRSIYLGCMRCFEKGLSHSPFSKFPFKILEVFGVCVWGSSCPRAFLLSLRLLNFLISSFDALGPRGGPYFLLLQKVGKDRRKGVSPPCESPDQSGVLDAPLWKPPSPRWRGKFSRTPRRLRGWSFGAVGEGRERVRARHDCRTSTASGWGLHAPWPPTFPKRKSLPIMRV